MRKLVNPSLSVAHQLVWKQEELFLSSRKYFNHILDSCLLAQHTIDIEVYLFAQDPVGDRLISALIQAAQRGVRIRVLVDGMGSPHWIFDSLERLPQRDVFTRVYHPVFNLSRWPKIKQIPFLLSLIQFIYVINRRDHKKVFIFDDRVAYVGGVNVSEASLEWWDAGVRVEGKGVENLREAFEYNWERSVEWAQLYRFKWNKRIVRLTRKIKYNPFVELNHLWRLRRRKKRKLLARMKRAKDRIWMSNPYWVPGPLMMKHLLKAAQSGVDVRLCLPKQSDIFFTSWVGRLMLVPLLPGGVKIYEYQKGFSHAKIILIDDWGRVGSSNLNYRSQYQDLEVDVILCKKENIEKLARGLMILYKSSHQISFKDGQNLPWLQKWMARFLLVFKWWL